MPIINNMLSKYLNPVFIETGSFMGDGIQAALNAGFNKIYSIELSHKLFNLCFNRFIKNSNVILIEGDVEKVLLDLILKINTNITFWLDAHYSGGETVYGSIHDPIFKELDIIEQHPIKTHTIIIDDMRAYDKKVIEERLLKINSNYKFYYEDGYIKNDILVALYNE